MRIDRLIDWEDLNTYIVADWVDLGNGVGLEMEVYCRYYGDVNDWPNGTQDYSKLRIIKSNEPDYNVFADFEDFEIDREKAMLVQTNATVFRDVKKTDPIFIYGFNKGSKNGGKIISHIFEAGVIK